MQKETAALDRIVRPIETRIVRPTARLRQTAQIGQTQTARKLRVRIVGDEGLDGIIRGRLQIARQIGEAQIGIERIVTQTP